MKLVFDLQNLNPTADVLVRQNALLPGNEGDPLSVAMTELAAAAEAKVRQHPLARLQDDALREVAYTYEGGSGVCFWLAIESSDGRVLGTPAKRLGDPYTNNDRYSVKDLAGMPADFDGFTITPHFFVRLDQEADSLVV